MFAYNPGVIDRSGEIRAAADIARTQRQQQAMMDGAGLVGDVAKTAVGFAVGGPAGAAMASGGGGGGGGDLIGTLVSSFANKKAMDAKDKAYMGFFERHGDQLGFDGDYLAQLKNMDRDERVAAFDLMTGQPGQRLGSLNYLNQQMGPRAAYGTGAAASAAPRESFTF
jgi:hypothetical protein